MVKLFKFVLVCCIWLVEENISFFLMWYKFFELVSYWCSLEFRVKGESFDFFWLFVLNYV